MVSLQQFDQKPNCCKGQGDDPAKTYAPVLVLFRLPMLAHVIMELSPDDNTPYHSPADDGSLRALTPSGVCVGPRVVPWITAPTTRRALTRVPKLVSRSLIAGPYLGRSSVAPLCQTGCNRL